MLTRTLAPQCSAVQRSGTLSLISALTVSIIPLTPFPVQVADLAVQVPNYYDYIPPEQGRDLIMIKRKLESDQYATIEALEADFDLMISNCYTFNGTESHVSVSARVLAEKFHQGIKRIRTGTCLPYVCLLAWQGRSHGRLSA